MDVANLLYPLFLCVDIEIVITSQPEQTFRSLLRYGCLQVLHRASQSLASRLSEKKVYVLRHNHVWNT